ncbi:MAG: transglycosylase SLT domain-containing protein [Xanthomonadales bacterium]|nr:transglycosylase SLT domain-containing protein [Xanthomonadales bacterium]
MANRRRGNHIRRPALRPAGWLLAAGLLLCALPVLSFETINRIKSAGELRVGFLEPVTLTGLDDRELALELAQRLGVTARTVGFSGYDDLLAALRAGTIDLVGETLALDRRQFADLAPSLPIRHADLWLVSSPFVNPGPDASLAVQFGSDAWHQALGLRDQQFSLKVVPADWSRGELLQRVAAGQLEASLAYSHELATLELPGLRQRRQLDNHLALGWIFRSQDRVLAKRVNDFLREHGLTRRVVFQDHGDWSDIRKRRRIRMVTVYRPETYFAWSGQLLGFEYEMGKAFAEAHGLELEVVIARDAADMAQRLRAGEADFAAGFLLESGLDPDLVAAEPHFLTRGRLVSAAGRFSRVQATDLHDRTLLVASTSPHRGALDRWRQAGIGVRVKLVDGHDAEILDLLARGEADFALVDDHQYLLESLWRSDVKGWFRLEQPSPRVWAVRGENPELKQVLDQHWTRERDRWRARSVRSKYFAVEQVHEPLKQAVEAFVRHGSFSPYDDLIRRYAAYYAFDWRLIMAVVFQESRFDPRAVSRSGARGLMQVQDVASRQVGITDLFNPQSGIHAGVKYLDWARAQFEADLDVRDRTWFSLAAYNGGLTHVKAARALARRQGLNDRLWFGHVEKAMALVASPEHDPDGRYQALDADQVINYVSRIRDYFEMYVRVTAVPVLDENPGNRAVAASAVAPSPKASTAALATPRR